MRRLAVALAFLGALLSPVFAADHYPTRVVTIVVPFAPGGASDSIARILGLQLERLLKKPVIIENRPGGSTSIAATAVATSTADGYTLLLGTNSLTINEALNRKFSYKLADLRPIGLIATSPVVLVGGPSAKYVSLSDLITALKEGTATASFGTPGVGSTGHLAGELLKQRAGINIVHVPFKGDADAVSAALAGHVELAISAPVSVLEHIQSKTLKAFGVSSGRRLESASDIPTLAEQGLPEYELVGWFGIFAPASVPDAIVSTLNSAIQSALTDETLRSKFRALGLEPAANSPEQFRAQVAGDTNKYREIVSAAKIE